MKKKDRIYVCHTFYHVYITLLKELNLPRTKRGKATLVLSRMSNDFGNLKERLSCRRPLSSSEASTRGKLFVEFIALIFLSYINRKMQENGLYKEYTMEKLLLELESIQSICEPGRAPIVCEVLEKQRKIYEAMEVMPPQ